MKCYVIKNKNLIKNCGKKTITVREKNKSVYRMHDELCAKFNHNQIFKNNKQRQPIQTVESSGSIPSMANSSGSGPPSPGGAGSAPLSITAAAVVLTGE